MNYTLVMEIIYAVCSWGLGHATRSLPVIRKLIKEDNHLTIISYDRALALLRKELGEQAKYIAIRDYPMLISENARQFMAKSMVYWPVFIKRMEDGLQQLTRILQHRSYDTIISDGRYDMYSKKIPSVFISHQMRIMNPLRIRMLESGSELFNQFFFKRFKAVIVPDYPDDDLSGELSHNLRRIKEEHLHYVGVLSDFSQRKTRKDIDVLISISGPEPQRTFFEKKILSQLKTLSGKIVVTLGKTEEETQKKEDKIQLFSFVSKPKREELLNRTKIVVSRSGYSTIMDIATIGCKALLIPTPGQIEQEYLGKYHAKKNTFYAVDQQHLSLEQDVKKAAERRGIRRNCSVDKSVENIMSLIKEYT